MPPRTNLWQLRFQGISDLKGIGDTLMQLRYQYDGATKTLSSTGYTSDDLKEIADFILKIAAEAKKRIEERQERRPQQLTELEALIKEAKANERFMVHMQHVAEKNPYVIAGGTDLDSVKEAAVILQSKVRVIHDFGVRPAADRWSPSRPDGAEGSEKDVMGVLYDPNGYTHETLYRRSRQLVYDTVQPGRNTGSSVTNEELQKQQGMYATLEGTCQELRTARDDLSRNNAVLKERVENLTNNYDNLKSDYQRQGTALSGREEENIGLQKSISAIGQDKAQLEGKLDASAKSVVRLEDEVTRVRDKISRLEQERNELTSRLASSGAELARTQAERDSNASRVAETQTLVKSRDERIKTQQEMLLNAASNEGTISGLTDQIERAWTARENADKALEAMRKAKDALERKAQGLEDTLEATKEEMASVQSQFDSATNNSNMQVEALQKAAEQQKNTIDNLHTGVRRILDDGDQSVINLGKEDDVTNALHIVVMTETELEERHARQEEPGAFQPLWTELLATHFQTKITPKSLATLLKYIAHSGNHHVVGEIDDLAHLQMDWVRHPRSANEPSWVWFDIGVILEKSLRVAFEQRDALRLCMILSLSTQLDHILGPLNKTSFLRDQVDQDFFKEMILGLGLMGFIPFVMVSRYLAAHGQLRWMDDQPGYEKLYGGRNRKMLSAWASEVPRQTNLVRVINSMEMQELAISFHTLRWEKTERSTGYKISFFMQLTTGVSTLENESMMFLEVPPVVNPDADDTTAPTPDSVVVFNPPFDIQVEITERHYELRMKFKKGSEGFKVNIANKNDNLLKWVKRFHNDRYKEAVSIASRNDTVLNLKVPKVEGIDQ